VKITMEATDQITHINGVEARVWNGVTGEGVECKCFVQLIAVRHDADSDQFDRTLRQKLPPARVVDLRQVL